MDNKDNNNKTLIIVIIALVAVLGCILISCCAISFYSISKIDREELRHIMENGNNFSILPIQNVSNEIQGNQNNKEGDTIIDKETEGLTPAELSIIQTTEKVRGITAEEKLAPVYKTEDELRNDLMGSLSDVDDDSFAEELGLYNILGFAPDDFDLRQFYVDMYAEQIAGFYDPNENQMYLVEDISDYENALTLAHEYTHYLQYNHPQFDETLNYDDDFCDDNGETCIIIDALVEGDATLTENLIDADSILKDYDTTVNQSSSGASVFSSAPKFFQDNLLFPYVYGFDFVFYHYLRGGFDAVNDLYITLPQSIEQIMHPEKYLEDEPVPVTLEPFRSIIAGESEIIREDVMNEADILMVLGSGYNEEWQLTERQAQAGAAGWGGGSYIFAEKDDKPLFFSKIVWDSIDEAIEAETAFEMYSNKRFTEQTNDNAWTDSDGSSIYLIRQADVLYWMILPDNFEAESLVDLIVNGSAL